MISKENWKYVVPGLLILAIISIDIIFITLGKIINLSAYVPSPKALVLYPLRYMVIILLGFYITRNKIQLASSRLRTYTRALSGTLGLIFIAAATNVFIAHFVETWLDRSPDKFSVIHHFVLAVIFAPILEEIFFRGVFLEYLIRKKVFNMWTCIIVSALFFGVIHINSNQIVFNSIMGLGFGYYYYKTRNILVPILCHAFQNFIYHMVHYIIL